MPRHTLDEAQLHPAIRERVARHERAIVEEVQAAVAEGWTTAEELQRVTADD